MSHETMRRISGVAAVIAWPLMLAAVVAALAGVTLPASATLLLAAVATSGTVSWVLLCTVPNLFEAWSGGVAYQDRAEERLYASWLDGVSVGREQAQMAAPAPRARAARAAGNVLDFTRGR